MDRGRLVAAFTPCCAGRVGKPSLDRLVAHGDRCGVRIARKGIESSERLGRHRWVIERTISWLTGYHRLNIRCDRKATHFLGFLTLAAALTCYKKLVKSTT
ncbi:transposase [Nocardia sp. NPDC047648]|uniref:transposase n=1 Tax=Nocardia sp. NPDC047648 TaxID=3155625 RepID=UPI0033C2722F